MRWSAGGRGALVLDACGIAERAEYRLRRSHHDDRQQVHARPAGLRRRRRDGLRDAGGPQRAGPSRDRHHRARGGDGPCPSPGDPGRVAPRWRVACARAHRGGAATPSQRERPVGLARSGCTSGEAAAGSGPPDAGTRGLRGRRRGRSRLRADRPNLHVRPLALCGAVANGHRGVAVPRGPRRSPRRGVAERRGHGARHRGRIGIRDLPARPGARRPTPRGARGAGTSCRRGRPVVPDRDSSPRRSRRARSRDEPDVRAPSRCARERAGASRRQDARPLTAPAR